MFLPLAEGLIAECDKAGVPVRVITTLRLEAEQAQAVRNGVSWTMKSMHLPQPPEGKSKAIDICPLVLLETKNWSPKHPLWWTIGEIGQKLGLRWGGDWAGVGPSAIGAIRSKWDPGHFELKP